MGSKERISLSWLPRVLVLLFCISSVAECSFAAMSIDLGSQFIKVGLVKPGVPMEIVLNKESRRKTPNLVSIRNNERVFADAALAINVRYPTSVYGNLVDLVAKNIDHPSVALFQKRFPHLKLEKHANDSSVVFPIGDVSYSVETLLAMILSSARDFTEAYAEQTVKDAVITVPAYFSQAERLAIEKAAHIANLNLLQLINDGTAAGLNYGVFRRKEITDKPQRLLIYDMGSSKAVATLVEYKLAKQKHGKEPKMTILGVGYDRTLGGLEITLRLRDLIIDKFRHNYKTTEDVTKNEKAMGKLMKEAERVKQVLSANVDHYAQIESLHEDKDMRVHVTRDELNSLIGDLTDRIGKPIEQALAMAELKIEEVDQVVLMGAGTRVPKVQEEIQKAIGSKELGRFLNTDEAIAMGALFQAAHLSKGFKVKPFLVDELVLFPVQLNFISKQKQENGEILDNPITRQLFQYKTYYPTAKKIISFTSFINDFSFVLSYGDLGHFKKEQIDDMQTLVSELTTIYVGGLATVLDEKVKPEETEFKGVKVGFELDGSGIVRTHKAEAIIQRKSQGVVESITNTISGFFTTQKEEGEPTSEERKEGDEATDGGESEAPEETLTSSTEPEKSQEEETKKEEKTTEKKEEAQKEEEKAEKKTEGEGEGEKVEKTDADKEKEKKETNATAEAKAKKPKIPELEKVVLKTNLDFGKIHLLSKDEVESAKKILEKFDKQEKLKAERAAAENELEAFAFEASMLPDEADFTEFSTEVERESLIKETKRVRAWLEDDTTPETKTSEFTKNLNAIKDIVRPVKKRIAESKTLPTSLTNLESMLNSSRVFTTMGGELETSLFKKNDTDAFGKKLDKFEAWLEEKKKAQAKKKLNEDPAFTTAEVEVKIKSLDRELKSFMKKMKATKLDSLPKKEKTDKKKETSEKKSDGKKKDGKEEDGKNETDKKEKAVDEKEKKTEL